MINIVIYSKDRPMQLDACLCSLYDHFKEVTHKAVKKTVVYTTSHGDFEKGYESLKTIYADTNFVSQTDFRQNTLTNIDLDNRFTMFLVDDILFKRNFSVSDSVFGMLNNNSYMLAISLRLHKGINYCYAIDKDISQPQFIRNVPNEFCVWKWPGCEGDWGYGFSLDGNIYNTKYIVSIMQKLQFNNPNELEAVLNAARHEIQPIYMCCYEDDSKLFNVPANRVQKQFENRHADSYSAEELHEKFMTGERIDITKYNNLSNYSVHFPVEYEFAKE